MANVLAGIILAFLGYYAFVLILAVLFGCTATAWEKIVPIVRNNPGTTVTISLFVSFWTWFFYITKFAY